MRARRQVLIGLGLMVCSILMGPWQSPAQDVSVHDEQRIAFAAQRGFEHIVQLWKDERFGELYELGTFASRADLSPEAFTYYMARAIRTLQCCWETLRDVRTRFETPHRVYVTGRLRFDSREFLVVRGRKRFIARGFLKEETLTFLLQGEEEQWRIDLFRILALSGVSLEAPGALLHFERIQ